MLASRAYPRHNRRSRQFVSFQNKHLCTETWTHDFNLNIICGYLLDHRGELVDITVFQCSTFGSYFVTTKLVFSSSTIIVVFVCDVIIRTDNGCVISQERQNKIFILRNTHDVHPSKSWDSSTTPPFGAYGVPMHRQRNVLSGFHIVLQKKASSERRMTAKQPGVQ